MFHYVLGSLWYGYDLYAMLDCSKDQLQEIRESLSANSVASGTGPAQQVEALLVADEVLQPTQECRARLLTLQRCLEV